MMGREKPHYVSVMMDCYGMCMNGCQWKWVISFYRWCDRWQEQHDELWRVHGSALWSDLTKCCKIDQTAFQSAIMTRRKLQKQPKSSSTVKWATKSQPSAACSSGTEDKTERKQQLRAGQSLSREKTQHSLMSTDSRLMHNIILNYGSLSDYFWASEKRGWNHLKFCRVCHSNFVRWKTELFCLNPKITFFPNLT